MPLFVKLFLTLSFFLGFGSGSLEILSLRLFFFIFFLLSPLPPEQHVKICVLLKDNFENKIWMNFLTFMSILESRKSSEQCGLTKRLIF